MTCRHQRGDRSCTSQYPPTPEPQIVERVVQVAVNVPDPTEYEITRVERVGEHLILEAQYPSCSKCSFEGKKVMVFLHVTELQALRWKQIDPHFRDPLQKSAAHAAPTPAARFPATSEGWSDAVGYANMKSDTRS